MTEKPYFNFSKDVRVKLLPKWKAYREFFGLEANIVKNLESEGKSKQEIDKTLEERKKDMAALWPEIRG